MRFDPTTLTPSVLAAFRHQTDPLADQVVQAIIESGNEMQINAVMMHLMRNDSFHQGLFAQFGQPISTIIDEYISTSALLPTWADADMLRQGERVFSDYGPMVFLLLNVSSLPMCYTCAHGAEVLYRTGRLLTHGGSVAPLARRLMETGQMVINCLAPGGMAPGGKGIVTLQKVRLIHASIRYFLRKTDAGWDAELLGEPINQEDLAGTLMSFGPVILSGLKKLNIPLTQAEEQSYMHCWKVVGYLMGIDEALLPGTYAEGLALATRILKHQAAPSEAGIALTASCAQFIASVLPGNIFDEAPAIFMQYFLEEFSTDTGIDLAACIGVGQQPGDHRAQWLLRVTRFLTGEKAKLEQHKAFEKLAAHINRLLIKGMVHHFNDGKQVVFNIPPSLSADWGLSEEWVEIMATPSIFGKRLALQKSNLTIDPT